MKTPVPANAVCDICQKEMEDATDGDTCRLVSCVSCGYSGKVAY